MEKKNRRPWHAVLVMIVSIVTSIAIIVFACLQLTGKWEGATNVVVPLLGVSTLCQAYTQWERSRKIAYFSIGTAIFILICSVVVFFIK